MQTETTQTSNGATTNSQAPSNSPPTDQKRAGSTFDLVRKVGEPTEAGGKAEWAKHGTLFMRANGSGGVVYLKLDGKELEIAVFPRKPRK